MKTPKKIPRVRLSGSFSRGLLDREVHGVEPKNDVTFCERVTDGYGCESQSTKDAITCNACLSELANPKGKGK